MATPKDVGRSRLRVVSVTDDLTFGGDEARLLAFSRTVDASRIEHRVLTLQRETHRNQPSTAMRRQFADAGIRIHDLDVPNALEGDARSGGYLRSAQRAVRKAYRLVRALRKIQPDLVDAHLVTGGLIGALAARCAGTPAVVTLYEPDPFTAVSYHASSFWERCVWSAVGQLTFVFARGVITDSERLAGEFRKWMWRRRPVFVIPNGVDAPAPQTQMNREEMRQRLGLPSDSRRKIIGQVSGLVPYKGLTVLLDAAVRVLGEVPESFFVVVGYDRTNEGYKEFLQQRASALGIADSFRIVSYPGPIAEVWPAFDIHVHASLMDSLPNSIMEGMSLGLPAVVTSVGGITEMVTHDETGMIVPPGDPNSLAASLVDLLRHPQKAARLGHAARNRYCERYRTEIMTRSLERLFASLAGQPA